VKSAVKKPGKNYPTTTVIPVDGTSGQYNTPDRHKAVFNGSPVNKNKKY